MNNMNGKEKLNITEVEYSDDLQPEDVLRSLMVLITHPANSIEGWTKILLSPELEEHNADAPENILKDVEAILIILQKAKAYLNNHQQNS